MKSPKAFLKEVQKMSKEEKYKIYNLEKRKLIEVRHFLSKFILILQNNYEIKIQGEYPDVKSQVGNYCHQNALGDEFFKNDFQKLNTVIPLYMILKFHS